MLVGMERCPLYEVSDPGRASGAYRIPVLVAVSVHIRDLTVTGVDITMIVK